MWLALAISILCAVFTLNTLQRFLGTLGAGRRVESNSLSEEGTALRREKKKDQFLFVFGNLLSQGYSENYIRKLNMNIKLN